MKEKVNKKNVSFHIIGTKGGAGDAINRIRTVYSFLSAFFSGEITLKPYENYHCKGIDFLKLYGLDGLIDTNIPDTLPKIDISFLSEYAFLSNNFCDEREGKTFIIDVSDMNDVKKIQYINKKYGVEDCFSELLNYTPMATSNNYFSDNCFKVVAHFRRNDILGNIFSESVKQGPIGKYGLHARRLVTWEDVERIVIEQNFSDIDVELILVSDGISKQLQDISKKENKFSIIEQMISELKEGKPKMHNVKVKDRLIGNTADLTLKSLDSMYYADLVISGSSVFPNLICDLGKTRLIKVQ